MALIEKATAYILGILTEDETVKNFPKEFVSEAAKWIRSWFLKDDPKTEARIMDTQRTPENKKGVIEAKLEDALENPTFKAALEQQLNAFEQQKSRLKNVVNKADIDVIGNVHIGDKGSSSGDNYDEKNIIKGGTIKAGGDFRLGDDVVSGNQNVQIVHNYFGNNAKVGDKTPPQYASLKSELKALLGKGKTADVISRLLNMTETNDNDAYNSVLMQSARLHRVADKEERRIVSESEANVERNQINDSLTKLIDKLEI